MRTKRRDVEQTFRKPKPRAFTFTLLHNFRHTRNIYYKRNYVAQQFHSKLYTECMCVYMLYLLYHQDVANTTRAQCGLPLRERVEASSARTHTCRVYSTYMRAASLLNQRRASIYIVYLWPTNGRAWMEIQPHLSPRVRV